MHELHTVVIVGASLAGLRSAERLRSDGFEGRVVVIGAEAHRPYDRPPLSKKVLTGEWDPERIHLRQPDAFDELDVEWRLGVRATSLDLAGRALTLDDDSTIGWDGLVIATGAHPRRIAGQERHRNVHELRTLDDSLALRVQLAPGDRRVVVIGAGFIGLEVAATAHGLGNRVTVLEGLEAPLIRGLGAQMGAAIADLHRGSGVDVRTSVTVAEITEDAVVLADGEVVPADVLVVGIGVAPTTAWLEGSGVQLRDGVVCDATLAAVDDDGRSLGLVYAAGDVARWTNELFGEEMRVEHWSNAAEQGAVAAANLLATARGEAAIPCSPVPFFWSDQLGHRIQFLGRAAADDDVDVVAGSIEEGKWLALYGSHGRFRGALGVNAPRWVMPMQRLLLERASWDEARSAARVDSNTQ